MTIKQTNFFNDEGEKVIRFSVLDNNNQEIDRFLFYNKKGEKQAEQEISETQDRLSELFKKFYLLGKNGVELDFCSEDIYV